MQSFLEQMCVKAQDKLLQTPNTLNLQQCLTVCRHYESLSLHIQQIQSGADKQVEILQKHHPKLKRPGPNKTPTKRSEFAEVFAISIVAIVSSEIHVHKILARSALVVAMNYIRTDPKIVQHGV